MAFGDNRGIGMLGDLFQPKARDVMLDEQSDENRQRFLAEDPFKAMAYTAYSGADMAGKGAARAGLSLAGEDPRSPVEKNTQAVEAAKTQVSQLGFDPADPKSMDAFYKQVIQILQRQGLAAEALAVAKEWQDQKRKDFGEDLKNRDLQRKVEKDKASDALGYARIEALAKKGVKNASAVGKILGDMDMEENKTPERRALLQKGLDNLLGAGWKSVDLGDRVEIRGPGGVVIDTAEKGMTPVNAAKKDAKAEASENAYNQALLALQRQYDAGADLYNMNGVKGITGRFGQWVGEPDKNILRFLSTVVSPADARAALAKHEQVGGGAFLSGLAVLKRASATGATGLGAVSEKEGDKVQADAAALNRMQDAVDYRKQLAIYLRYIESYAAELAAGAKQDGADVKLLKARALTGPKGSKPVAAPAAPATAVQPPAAGGDMVKVLTPDGRPGSIPRDKLERALQQGYKERR